MLPKEKLRETKLTVAQKSLSDLLYSWKFTKPSCDGSHWSTFAGNSVLLPSDFIDFAMLLTPRFWQETDSLLDFM